MVSTAVDTAAVAAAMKAFHVPEYDGKRSSTFVFVNSLKRWMLSERAEGKYRMIRVIQGPPQMMGPDPADPANMIERYKDTVNNFKEELLEIDAAAFEACSERLYAKIDASLPEHKRHVTEGINFGDGYQLFLAVIESCGSVRERVLDIHNDLDKLKLDQLTENTWNKFLSTLSQLRNELSILPKDQIQNGDLIDEGKCVQIIVNRAGIFFPNIEAKQDDPNAEPLTLKSVLHMADRTISRKVRRATSARSMSASMVTPMSFADGFPEMYPTAFEAGTEIFAPPQYGWEKGLAKGKGFERKGQGKGFDVKGKGYLSAEGLWC